MTPRRLAVVTPWFGRAPSGRVERFARRVTEAMHARGHIVEVFAGGARPGTTVEAGVTTHRFALDTRGSERSHALESAIAARHDEFDRLLFVGYLGGDAALYDLDGTGERTVLHPCLREDAYDDPLALSAAFHAVPRLFFESDGERALAASLYGPATFAKATVTGRWIDAAPARYIRARRFRRRFGSRYVLYLGTGERRENLPLLLRAFHDFRRERPGSRLRLVLAGPGTPSLDAPRDGVYDLGEVSDSEKWSIIAEALAIAQPSERGGVSQATIEAWALLTPVIVHGRNREAATTVRDADGGLVAETRTEWTRALDRLDLAEPVRLQSFGKGGHLAYLEGATAKIAADRYEAALFGEASPSMRRAARTTPSESAAIFDDRERPFEPYDVFVWDRAPDEATMRRLADGRRRILYAGHEIGEADACADLLAAFAHLLSFEVDAVLAIVGTVGDTAARSKLRMLIERHGLGSRVDLEEAPSLAVARGYFQSSHLYVSLADRPSSLVALADARAARIPTIAFAGGGVARVLGTSGLQLARKDSVLDLAALMKLALTDPALRSDLIADGVAWPS